MNDQEQNTGDGVAAKREIKFRVWDKHTGKMIDHDRWGNDLVMDMDGELKWYKEREYQGGSLDLSGTASLVLMQYTGLQDRNGKEIYEGDVIRVRETYRSTQTHYGDNIPNGEYTEPLEAEVRTEIHEVIYMNGTFGVHHDEADIMPLMWTRREWTERDVLDSVGEYHGIKFNDPEEGDLKYLLDSYKLADLPALLAFLGTEVIGNIYENPELLRDSDGSGPKGSPSSATEPSQSAGRRHRPDHTEKSRF